MFHADAAYCPVDFQYWIGSEFSPNIYGEPASIPVIRVRAYRAGPDVVPIPAPKFPEPVTELEDFEF
jgi:hypothetical protein